MNRVTQMLYWATTFFLTPVIALLDNTIVLQAVLITVIPAHHMAVAQGFQNHTIPAVRHMAPNHVPIPNLKHVHLKAAIQEAVQIHTITVT